MNKWIIFVMTGLVFLTACKPEIPESYTKDQEFLDKALVDDDASLCGNIINENIKGECISKIGIKILDTDICDMDEKTKNFCYERIAEMTKDESLCNAMDSDYWWNICYDDLGKVKQDASLCLEIRRNDKVDSCLQFVAEDTNDDLICHKISAVEIKEECLYNVGTELNEIEICLDIDGVLKRDTCLKKIAENMGKASICNNIESQVIKERCFETAEVNEE